MSDPSNLAAATQEVHLEPEAIQAQLERILKSPTFQRSERNTSFLRLIVEEALAGRTESISAYRLGLEIFGRDRKFDPQTDPIVRIQAVRLRRALDRYYFLRGSSDPIRIDVPKGRYTPVFRVILNEDADNSPPDSAPSVPRPTDPVLALPTGPSIAVLPFVNLGDDPDQEFLAAGIAEELIVELNRFQDFRVIARYSTLKYKGGAADVREVGRDLGVRYALEGSVRRSGGILRITVEVSETRTGAHIWAERFESDMRAEDLFDVQDRITSQVVAKVADNYGVIPRELSKESRRKRTSEISTYEAALRFHCYNAVATPELYEETRSALERAIELDPDYAPAWAMLSELCSDDYLLGFSDRPGLLDEAKKFASRAVSLDPECQHAHWAMAWSHFHRREPARFLAEAEKVIALNPNAAYLVGITGWTTALVGEWDRGLALLRKGIDLNPNHPGYFHIAPFLDHMRKGEYGAALTAARRINMPELVWDPLARAAALGCLGQSDEGLLTVGFLLDLDADFARNARRYVSALVFDDALVETIVEGLRSAGLDLESSNSP